MAAPANKQHDVKAVILAGGSGSRLYPLTEDCPAFLLPIGNRPLLWHQLEALESTGFTSVLVLTTEALCGAVRDVGRLRGARLPALDVLAVPADGGSGHALLRARERLPGEFLLLPADVLLPEPAALLQMADVHRAHQAAATVLLTPAPAAPADAAPAPAAGKKGKAAAAGDASPALSAQATVVGLAGPPDALRLVFMQPAELFAAAPQLVLSKPLLRAHPHVRMHSAYHDPHVYMFGRACWDVWEAKRKRKQLSVREDLLPALVRAAAEAAATSPAPAPHSPAAPSPAQAAAALPGSSSGDVASARAALLRSSSMVRPLRSTLTQSVSMLSLPLPHLPAQPAPEADAELGELLQTELGAFALSTSAAGVARARELQSDEVRCFAHVAAAPPQQAVAADPLQAAPVSIRRLDSVQALLELNRVAAAGGLGRLDEPAPAEAGPAPAPAVAPSASVGAGCLLAPGVRVGERAALKHTVLGKRCVVGAGCKLVNAVLLDGVVLADGCSVISSVLGRDVQLAERCSVKDSALGAGVRLAAHSELVSRQLVRSHPDGGGGHAGDDDEDDDDDADSPAPGRPLAHSSGSEH